MKFKKSEAKEFIKNKNNFDKYAVHNFVNFCQANSLFYKDLEEAYNVFIVDDPIFHDCGLSMAAKKAYPIRLFYDDNGYHFLDDRCTSILNSYHFVFRFPNMKDALATFDKKYIDTIFNEIYKNCKKHNHKQLRLCFEFYKHDHHDKVSVCETIPLDVEEAKSDLEDILKNSVSSYTNTYVASYFGE